MTIHAFRMRLKPGVVDEYRRRHDAIWPELSALLTESGIHDYSIFLNEETLSLFAVLKLTDDNRRDTLPDHPVMQRWWAYMAPLMEVEPDNRPKEWPLPLIFHHA
ncbi:L-rhamnose mutarotase [Sphingomonas carotinifaciens]|uniref:L-rhamnose mutarotase n=1 Tax=Sphingomonas carotinifaciens TaxID=1166323 RepID=A0A1G7HZD2_9SPHN|nr:L-rhamnose mutarotase [Sphingomonas carotinifaciens]MBB4085058.1 L-rhamnose mutarotase [Sphingomonas carotinifaciens]MWC44437.1 L-rhamnose mutarotase [Sphingomonas carotinifaciens]SDF05917.1 L-rhamnose mutarotase [Sphingomonas carotinifaciens]